MSKEGAKNFSKKFFFDPKFSKNLYFWPFLVKNSINLVSLQSSIGVGMRAIAQNDRNTILLKWVKKNFKISPPKKSKIRFFGPKNGQKWPKNRKNFRNFFLVKIDLEWSKTCFKTKISILKIFSRWKFFFRDIAIFSKNGVTGRKNGKDKNFWSKNFFGPNRFRMVQNVF